MERDSTSFFENSRFVKELSESSFDEIKTWKLKNGKCGVILFYAPWCGYCKSVKDVYKNLAEKAIFFNVYAMNCEKYNSHISKIKDDMPNLISGYPTIIIYNKGEPIEKIGTSEEERTLQHLLTACMRICGEKSKKSI